MSTKPTAVEPSPLSSSVLCDMCLDSQTPALKTCLKCEISMCAQHLQAHLTTPLLLQTHPLTKPGGLVVVRCSEHGKPLEYYCLDDRLRVRVSCSIEDQQQLHNLTMLAVFAQKVLTEDLKEQRKKLAELEVQGKALKSWESLQRAMVDLRDISLTKVDSSVSARLDAIQAAQRSIEAALMEEDAHLFLQRFGDVYEAVQKAQAVDFIHGLKKAAEPQQVVFDLLKNGHEMVQSVLKLQRDILTLVDPFKLYWGTDKPTDMVFDENTVGNLLVSSDLKTLFCRSPTEKVSQTVYFKNSADFHLNWTMVFSEVYNWSVGVHVGMQHGHGILHGIEWKNKRLSLLQPQGRPTPKGTIFENKVEIFWDSYRKTLSFFTRGEYGQLIGLHVEDIERSPGQSIRLFVNLDRQREDTSSGSGTSSSHNAQSHGYAGCRIYADFVCDVHGLREYDPILKK